MCPSVCLLVVIGDWSGLSPQFRVSVQITQQVRTWGSPVLLLFLIRSQVRPGDPDKPNQLLRHWESGVDTRLCVRTKSNPEMEELMSWAWRDGTAPVLLHFHFSTLAMKGSDLNQQLGSTLTLLMISTISSGFFCTYLKSEIRLEVKHFVFPSDVCDSPLLFLSYKLEQTIVVCGADGCVSQMSEMSLSI